MKVEINGVQYAPIVKQPTNNVLLDALNVQMSREFEGMTVRDYLRSLLTELWDKREEFSGKRPFGNSGWEYDLYEPLVRDGFIEGLMAEGRIYEIDDPRMAHAFVSDLILAVFNGVAE